MNFLRGLAGWKKVEEIDATLDVTEITSRLLGALNVPRPLRLTAHSHAVHLLPLFP